MAILPLLLLIVDADSPYEIVRALLQAVHCAKDLPLIQNPCLLANRRCDFLSIAQTDSPSGRRFQFSHLDTITLGKWTAIPCAWQPRCVRPLTTAGWHTSAKDRLEHLPLDLFYGENRNVVKIVAVRSTQEPQNATGRHRCASIGRNRSLQIYELLTSGRGARI